ncbi:acyl carrier protein [Clostridium collagenovorans DSM 3089]|uniref:Acyl carrier protein n=1 Tax=Clostridium collagenovorans DSM 3089 TaxID=1121306 RepID=A0A1M5X9E0_9CLOT|nr:acyl carrier protein [Clostridium collagenovorans]SHH96467.1 acyl carrier protein [Clostridium collagenovorans DSM 3089]
MVFEKVKNILVKELSLDADQVTMEANLIDDLGVDSLDIFEVVMSLEEAFAIEISNDDIEDIKTVGDIVNYIQARIG